MPLTFGRPALGELHPYKVNFDPQRMSAAGVAKLDANELFNRVRDDDSSKRDPYPGIHRYPDPESRKLAKAIGRYIDVDPEQILIGNGSDELLFNLAFCFFGLKVAFPRMSYPVYGHLATISELTCVPLELDANFDLSDSCFSNIREERPDLVLLSYPNNPTGNCFSAEKIRNLADQNPETVFVLDEAYAEFSGKTFIPAALTLDNVVVLRTLSKAFGLAGLRIGYAIARHPILKMLSKVKLPYNVNSLSQAIAADHVDDQSGGRAQAEIRAHVAEVRAELTSGLARIEGVRPYPSEANFVFAQLPREVVIGQIHEILQASGIFIRLFQYEDLGPCARISVGTRADTAKVLQGLSTALHHCAQAAVA
jgi:histidinol-phosphate aminotransferase